MLATVAFAPVRAAIASIGSTASRTCSTTTTPGRRAAAWGGTLHLAPSDPAQRRAHLHHLPAADAARVPVHAPPDLPPLLQRRAGLEPDERALPRISVQQVI